jgi:hypothetical protein
MVWIHVGVFGVNRRLRTINCKGPQENFQHFFKRKTNLALKNFENNQRTITYRDYCFILLYGTLLKNHFFETVPFIVIFSIPYYY